MSSLRPWDTGDVGANWDGYFIPGTPVLRNRVGATTSSDLANAENDLVEVRVTELRNRPQKVNRTYDLTHMQSLHRFLFQDVYEWAGELRTVGIEKADESFIPPRNIAQPLAHVTDEIMRTGLLRRTPNDLIHTQLAYLYDYVNFAHPFREGNGRTQREFFDQLLAESDRGLAWNLIDKNELHHACHVARADGNLQPLTTMFGKIVDDRPAYRRT